jgi:predicted DNA-binding ribbon-helix-helix protein
MDTEFSHFAPEPRVVQFNKQRYSLRLEPVYWQWLESEAARQSKRIGQLIAELHDHHDGKNFSGYVRCFCMLGAVAGQTRGGKGEKKEEIATLKTAMLHSPAPGMIINQYARILIINDPLSNWLGDGHRPIINELLGDYFQLRIGGQKMDKFLTDSAGNAGDRLDFRFSYRARGRISTAKASVVRPDTATEHFLVWVSISPVISV